MKKYIKWNHWLLQGLCDPEIPSATCQPLLLDCTACIVCPVDFCERQLQIKTSSDITVTGCKNKISYNIIELYMPN
jgi:hypothetical protein